MLRNKPLMTWGFLIALSLPAYAQSDALNELYGNGVHAFNGGDYVEAYNQLTRAIDNGSRDPRVYYYRGLSYLRLGRPQEAEADISEAARLEMTDTDRFYNVSKALERVQGRPRLLIEKYRSNARLVAFHEREQARYERYERIRRNEPNVLLQPRGAEESAEEPAPAEEEMPAEEKPAAVGPAEEKAGEEMPAEDADKDPFGATDDEKPGKKTPAEDANEDPFGEPKEEMKDEADEPEAKPAKDPDDPFAEDEEMPAEKKADGDDSEAPPEPEEPAEKDPFAE